MTTAESLESEPSVQRWLASAGYDAEDPDERVRRLATVAEFCAEIGATPDELVASCLRTTKTGHTAISVKGRTAINAAIEAFVGRSGCSDREAVALGNTIRGFLIHNGIFIQGGAWRG